MCFSCVSFHNCNVAIFSINCTYSSYSSLTFTSIDCAGHSLVPRLTVARVRSIHVGTVGVGAAVPRRVLTFVDVLVTVRSSPATVEGATRRTADRLIAPLTATEILAVSTPATATTR